MAPKVKILSHRPSQTTKDKSPAPKRRKETPRASSSTVHSLPPSIPCASKAVTTGRCVRFHFLEQEGFELGENLIALGLQKLCSLEVPTYPNLVREFYGTAAKSPEGIIGKVRGTQVTVSKALLHTLLGIPVDGLEPYHLDKRELALNCVLDRTDCSPYMTISGHDLDAESRLLLSIIGRILFPKTGRFEFISERDLAIMYHILNTISFDMGEMMISHIGASIGQSRFSLPYGMVFTLIFRHYGITISEHESTIKLRHTDYYSDSTLHRMGFIKKNGEWVKTEKSSSLPSQVPTTDEPPSSTPDPSPPAAEPQAPTPASPSAPPSGTPSQIFMPADQMALLSSTILNALTPKLDELHKQNLELQNQNLELKQQNLALRSEFQDEISALKAQNLELQTQISSHHTPSNSSSSTASLHKDNIKAIAQAVLGEVKGSFTALQAQLTRVAENVEDLDARMDQLRKKLNKEAETLLKHVWDISLKVQEEHKDYGIDGISKELGMLKSKIDDAVQGIALLMHDLKKDSSKDLMELTANISLLTKEISKRFMLKM